MVQLLEDRRLALKKQQKVLYRVLVDGEQIGSYTDDDSILKPVQSALKDDEENIQIEIV